MKKRQLIFNEKTGNLCRRNVYPMKEKDKVFNNFVGKVRIDNKVYLVYYVFLNKKDFGVNGAWKILHEIKEANYKQMETVC